MALTSDSVTFPSLPALMPMIRVIPAPRVETAVDSHISG
jgi:hypothetical protein